MIAHTDQAVKLMLETRFGLPAIWTGETVSLMAEAARRFKLPVEIEKYEINGGDVTFPFCCFIRSPGMFDEQRFNSSAAQMGVMKGYKSQDSTRVQMIKMIPVQYPYAIKYYCSSVYESIRLEKLYYGLKVDPYLDKYVKLGFPDDFNSNFASYSIYIYSLDGFEPPLTDDVFAKGRFYTGNMGFSVNTWVAETIEVPIIKEIVANLYNTSPDKYLEKFTTGRN